MDTQASLKKKLKDRNITGDIINLAEWRHFTMFGVWGWQYAVKHSGEIVGLRWKNAYLSSNDKPKYAWVGGKPDDPLANFYCVGDIHFHVKNSNGVCYLANGEPSLLAYHSGGVHNVIATTLGETSVPDNLVDYLRDIGVTRLLYPFDKDASGQKSAVNFRDALAGTGIDYEALDLPATLPPKSDAGDLLSQVGSGLFSMMLGRLTPASLPKREVRPQRAYSTPLDSNQDLADALAQAMGVYGTYVNGDGWYTKKVTCPFHDDRTPDAKLSADTGVLYCFPCDDSFSPQKVAEGINIDWRQYIHDDEVVRYNPSKQPLTAQDGDDLEIQVTVTITRLVQYMRYSRNPFDPAMETANNYLRFAYNIRNKLTQKHVPTVEDRERIESIASWLDYQS